MLDDANAAWGGFPQGTDGVSRFDSGEKGVPRDVVATGDQLAADVIIVPKPVTALVYVRGPLPSPVDFTITGLSAASAATCVEVEQAIREVLREQGAPIAGSFVALSAIEIAIAAIAGTDGFVITPPATSRTRRANCLSSAR